MFGLGKAATLRTATAGHAPPQHDGSASNSRTQVRKVLAALVAAAVARRS
jgi:hypothetical protein